MSIITEKPRVAGRASIVSLKDRQKNTIPSQRLIQYATSGIRFNEMQQKVATFRLCPSDKNAADVERVSAAYCAAFSLISREVNQ